MMYNYAWINTNLFEDLCGPADGARRADKVYDNVNAFWTDTSGSLQDMLLVD